MKISLLHATYFSKTSPLAHKELWLGAADVPSRVSYVFGLEETDVASINKTAGHLRAITSPPDDYSSAVANWNSAAEIAEGDLLFVISDDLEPIAGWDTELERVCRGLDPRHVDFSIKIRDSPNRADTTLRHPVVSRKFYASRGLFDGKFRGVYCDNDITMRAFLFARILDGRELNFPHAHPHFERDVEASTSHEKINSTREYEKGASVFRDKYFPLHRGLNLNRLSLPTPHRKYFVRRKVWRLMLAIMRRTP